MKKTASKTGKRVVGIDDILKVRNILDVHFSPDGKAIICVVSEANVEEDRWENRLWLIPLEGAEPIKLTHGPKSDNHPRWSPDGKSIAFLSDREDKSQIWILPTTGGEAEELTSAKGGVSAFEWSPSGAEIAFIAQDKEKDGDDKEKDEKERAKPIEVDKKVEMNRLWLLDIESRKLRLLTKGKYDSRELSWAPSGKKIAFVRRPTAKHDDVFLSDIMIVAASGGPKKLIRNAVANSAPRWSPGGKQLAYLCNPQRNFGGQNDIWVASANGKGARSLTDSLDRNEMNYLWRPDGTEIVFLCGTETSYHLFSVPSRGGKVTALTKGAAVHGSFDLSPDGEKLAYVRSDSRHPSEVWIASTEGRNAKQITHFNRAMTKYTFGKTETVSWNSFDSLMIEGLLVLPARQKARASASYPLIVQPHGGPAGARATGFDAAWQHLAGKGYAVFAPNFRGSGNYGKEFVESNRGDWGGGDFRDIMTGVDMLIERGIADPERLVISGWSYGGYMTCWTITQTNRFKAAVEGEGLTNLESFYAQTDIQRFMEWYWFGPPWQNASLYRERSPMMHIKKVSTPLLILQGIEDKRVPLPQSEEIYIALKRRRVPVKFVKYPGEGHGMSRPSNQVDSLKRTTAWFERFLKKRGS